MCLAIPGKLIEITTDPAGVKMGRANFGGIVKQVCLEYTPEVETGDYVLVHVGFALSKVDEDEAARTYRLLDEMKQLGELDVPDIDPWPTEAASTGWNFSTNTVTKLWQEKWSMRSDASPQSRGS